MTITRAFPILAFLLHVALLSACGSSSGGGDDGSSSSSSSSTTSSSSSSTSSSSSSSSSSSGSGLVSTNGTQWLDPQGEAILFKGVNLGNWLLQEFWMMGQSTEAVNDQCTLEAELEARFGFAERERLMRLFRDNWITERDWDLMQSFGLNMVRLPFIWNLIEDEKNPMTLREDAWEYLDLAIQEAQERDMYVLLDLHGAVGSQGEEHHSGCAEKNEYWANESFQERTRWLWQQVATRYADNATVAAYGLLNEPWGTTPENLATEIKELYDAVREVDTEHVIVLPGHSAGIYAYGNPADQGMTKVAFEMHFYPGIFGWGEMGYAVHRDWLTCGESGTGGVCEWADRLETLNVPFLIGEFQPWAGLGPDLGAQISRATYDTYAQYGWASTAWSYKTVGLNGGQGDGQWGMVTNQSAPGIIAKSNTWVCPNWNSSITEACDSALQEFTVPGSGERSYYLVIKAGTTDGTLDVSLDSLALIPEGGVNIVNNGGFGTAGGWTEWHASAGSLSRNYNESDAQFAPDNATGSVLRLTAGSESNGGLYQMLSLQGGETYSFAGVFKDNGSSNAWAEIYLVPDQPQMNEDVTGQVIPQLDFRTAEKSEIEALFSEFGTLEYDVHEELRAELTTATPSTIFTLPAKPTGLSLQQLDNTVLLNWASNTETDLLGYNVYRSNVPGHFSLLAEQVTTPSYLDEDINEGLPYFYVVTAVDALDESYSSEQVRTESVPLALPGKIEAEIYSAANDVQVENSGSENAFNIGFINPGSWFEYEVDIAQGGSYTIVYQVASQDGSPGFQLLLDGEEIDSQSIPATGGWQEYSALSSNINLSAGVHVIRFNAVGGGWNVDYFEISAM